MWLLITNLQGINFKRIIVKTTLFMRTANIVRKTKETSITVDVNLDGTGEYDIKTGVGFLDHMLEQVSKHSLIDLKIKATGDIHIDLHHTTEDTGIAIGEAIKKALGEKKVLKDTQVKRFQWMKL